MKGSKRTVKGCASPEEVKPVAADLLLLKRPARPQHLRD